MTAPKRRRIGSYVRPDPGPILPPLEMIRRTVQRCYRIAGGLSCECKAAAAHWPIEVGQAVEFDRGTGNNRSLTLRGVVEGLESCSWEYATTGPGWGVSCRCRVTVNIRPDAESIARYRHEAYFDLPQSDGLTTAWWPTVRPLSPSLEQQGPTPGTTALSPAQEAPMTATQIAEVSSVTPAAPEPAELITTGCYVEFAPDRAAPDARITGVVSSVGPAGFVVWSAAAPSNTAGHLRQADELTLAAIEPHGAYQLGDHVVFVDPSYRGVWHVDDLAADGDLTLSQRAPGAGGLYDVDPAKVRLRRRTPATLAKYALTGRPVEDGAVEPEQGDTTEPIVPVAPKKGRGKKAKASVSAPVQTAESTAAEAPASDTPPVAPAPILASSSVTSIVLAFLVPSPLNPRKHFDEAAIAELAESIAHKGLMQNLVVRPTREGLSEVIAGGRRLRALQLLAEQGRIDPDTYDVPVRIAKLDDLEALQLATAENVERRSMTPLEEADAFARMVELGATPEDIALRFGFNARTVAQRLVLARDLGNDGRELLAAGEITLGQAQILAQTTGPLRKHVLNGVKNGYTPDHLRRMIQNASFLVEHAKFNVQASGLEVIEDLFGDAPARFADPKAALAAQIDWVNARAEKLRAKGTHHFVDVVAKDSSNLYVDYSDYDTHHTRYKDLRGIVLLYSTQTGEVKEEGGVARRADIKGRERTEAQQEKAKHTNAATGSDEAGGAVIRRSGWVDAHTARATAIREALVGDHKRTVALTLMGLLGSSEVKVRAHWEDCEQAPAPAVAARLRALDERLGGVLNPSATDTINPVNLELGYRGTEAGRRKFYDALVALELSELLDLLSVVTAPTVGNWNRYDPQKPADPFLTHVAKDAGAVVRFRLTDEHLKAYPRARLLELAKDAGLDVAALEQATTVKDLRSRILEHADALAEQGFVPQLARFPSTKGKKA